MNYMKIQKMIKVLRCLKFIGTLLQKVLTLDKVEGISIREQHKLQEFGVDLKSLAENLIQHFLKQAVRDGFFHGDMHQGNLFVDKNGNIIPVDFGIMGRLNKNNRKFLAEILYGFIQRDYPKVAGSSLSLV